MKKFIKLTAFLAAVLVLGASGIAMANNVALQEVTYQVVPIHELSISGNPAALVINSATAGDAPAVVVDDSTSYSITTNEACHITGIIGAGEMPVGLTLSVALGVPGTAGTSAGDVVLTSAVQDLVTGITACNDTKTITYKFSAELGTALIQTGSKTVTLTVVTP
jgi:hypothetical protein